MPVSALARIPIDDDQIRMAPEIDRRSLDCRFLDDKMLSLWLFADHFLFALVEVEHPAFAI